MDSDLLAILSKFSYGLYVLSVEAEDWPMAMVVSWVSQISFDPPLIMVAVRKNRYAHELIKKQKAFSLSVMAPDDIQAMSSFKNPDARARLAGLKVTKGETGAPIIDFGLGSIECRLEDTFTKGDHTAFIARITKGELTRDEKPATTLDYNKVYVGKS